MTEINGLDERIANLKTLYQEAERLNLKDKAIELLVDINYLEELRELRNKQERCEDAVSRAEVKKIAKEMYLEVANMELDVKTISDCISYTSSKCREVLERKLQALPPVTPQEPRWIPVTEKLPEEKTAVLLSCDDMYLAKLNPCIGWISGNNWYTFSARGSYLVKYPIAWMPLPEPYKGGE